MFSRLAIFTTLSAALLAAASPALVARQAVGSTQACCDSTQPAESEAGQNLLGAIGVALSGLNIPIGVNCDPISVIGISTSHVCERNTYNCGNGITNGVGIGCVPVEV